MTPTKKDMDELAALMKPDFRNVIFSVIRRWEAIRPQDDTRLMRTNHTLAKEVERLQRRVAGLKTDIVELNQRMHERTQAFLAKEAKKAPAPLPAPKPTPEELERLEFEAWATGECYSIERKGYEYLWGSTRSVWAAWKAARYNNFRAAQ